VNRRDAASAWVLRQSAGRAVRWSISPDASWVRRRRRGDLFARLAPKARGVELRRVALGGVPADRIEPRNAADGAAMLYLHGGAYCVGSAAAYRHLTTRLARDLGVVTWAIDYRLAPEHPYPAGLEDALAAYRALVESGVSRVVVAGDSAGGGLTVALALAARDEGLPAPAALGLISPWLDLTVEEAAGRPATLREPFITPRLLDDCAPAYAGRHPRDHPLISPIFADLAGLPPIVLDSSADDLIVADGLRLAELVRAAGGEVDHRHHIGLWHVFHLLAGGWPVANVAVKDFARRLAAAAGPSPDPDLEADQEIRRWSRTRGVVRTPPVARVRTAGD
jgi:monoterpene epsilon-lactone hydrolase